MHSSVKSAVSMTLTPALSAGHLTSLLYRCRWTEAFNLVTQNPEALDHGTPLHCALYPMMVGHEIPPLALIKAMVCARPHLVCQQEVDYMMRIVTSGSSINTSRSQSMVHRNRGNDEDTGDTPLHKLFSFENYSRMNLNGIDDGETIESIARAFIEADPLCVRIVNKRGWLPLHTLCSNFLHAGHLMKPDFLKVLIEPYRESVIVENKGGVTPWEMLLSNFVYNVNEYRYGCGGGAVVCRLDVAMIRQVWHSTHNDDGGGGGGGQEQTLKHHHVLNHHKYDSITWACVLTMVEQSTTTMISYYDDGGCSSSSTQRPLHLLASSWLVDAKLMNIGLRIHGDKCVKMQDEEEGNLPLHIACMNHRCCLGVQDRDEHGEDEEEVSIVQWLIMAYPKGASVKNERGYIPLFLAIEKGNIGWEEGMRDLVQAYPESLHEKDPVQLLYPFLLMASIMERLDSSIILPERKQQMMTCLYHLIRACPELIIPSS